MRMKTQKEKKSRVQGRANPALKRQRSLTGFTRTRSMLVTDEEPRLVKRRQLDYLDARREEIKAVARKEFGEKGRGALLFIPQSESSWYPLYIPLRVLVNTALARYAGLVKGYDPEIEIVAIFMT